jgi:hypothetical protein
MLSWRIAQNQLSAFRKLNNDDKSGIFKIIRERIKYLLLKGEYVKLLTDKVCLLEWGKPPVNSKR